MLVRISARCKENSKFFIPVEVSNETVEVVSKYLSTLIDNIS